VCFFYINVVSIFMLDEPYDGLFVSWLFKVQAFCNVLWKSI